jgi:hypothetical protein
MTLPRLNFNEIRKQYPEYKDWSDSRLMNAIQRKQAYERSKENDEVGQPEQKGLSGIGNDVWQSFMSSPDALANMIYSIPGGAKNVAKYATSNNPVETLGNMGAGGVESAAGLLSAPQMLTRYLSEKFPRFGEFVQKGTPAGQPGMNEPTFYEALKGFEKEHGMMPRNEEEESVRNLGALLFGVKGLSKIPNAATRIGALSSEQAGRGGDPVHAAILGMIGETAAKAPWKKAKAIPEMVSNVVRNAPEMIGTGVASALETGADYASKIPGGAEILQPTVGALASYLKHKSVSPEKFAQRQLFGDITSSDLPQINERVNAAKRLGINFITPGESLLSPFQTAKEANIGKTPAGAKLLYAKGKERVGTEEQAINSLLDEIYNKKELSPEKQAAYKETMDKTVPDEFMEKWKQNPIVEFAIKQMETKPTYKSELLNTPKNSFEYWNIVKRVIGDLEKGEAKGMQGFSSNAATKIRNRMVDEMDSIQPQYEQARNLAEREFTRKDLESVFDKKNMTLNNFWSLLKSDKAFNKVMKKLDDFPKAQQKLNDIRMLSNEMIPFDESIRSSYKLEKTGMTKERNKLDALKRDLDRRYGQEHDVAAVKLMTDPNWQAILTEYLNKKGKQ